jgi:hypothetical protein
MRPKGVLGGGHRVALGALATMTPRLVGRLYVYVVHPDAGAADGLEVLRPAL